MKGEKEKDKDYTKLLVLCFIVFLTLFFVQISWLVRAYQFQKNKTHSEILRVMNNIGKEVNEYNYDLFNSKTRELELSELQDIEFIIDSIFQTIEVDSKFQFAIYSEAKDSFFQTKPYLNQATTIDFRESEFKICLTCYTSFSFVGQEALEKINKTNSTENIPAKYTYYAPVKSLTYQQRKPEEILWLSIISPDLNTGNFRSLLVLFMLSIILISFLLYFFTKIYKDFVEFKTMSGIKEDFINNITHEFKTPLSSIRLASKVLRKSKDQEKNKTYHQLIEKESDNLEQQIDRLLELSLIDSNQVYFDKEKIDLQSLIKDVISENELKIKNNNINVITNFQLANFWLYGDRYHLKNTFNNLLENAVKYGGPTISIYFETQADDSSRSILIKDTGTGISENDKNKIFERFYRGQKKNLYKEKGFGIGLSYVKSIIEEHGGEIDLNPDPQEGTEFIIKFDLKNE